MRYRHRNQHSVYWPAFADILTVVIVVLICTLAIRDKAPPPPPPLCSTCSPDGEITGNLPKTIEEFKLEVLANRSRCLNGHLRDRFGPEFVRPNSSELRICSFTGENGTECDAATTTLLSSLRANSPESFESGDAVTLTAYFHARTGLNSPSAETAKHSLTAAHDRIRAQASAWSTRLTTPVYQEEGSASRRSEVGLYLVPRLRKSESEKIAELWRTSKRNDLERLLAQTKGCEAP